MIQKARVMGSDFLGVYLRTLEDITFIPRRLEEDAEKVIQECLQTQTYRVLESDTQLIGTMMLGNNHGIIVNEGVDPAEIKKVAGDRNVIVLRDKLNAVGNDIVANERAAIVHKGFTKTSVKKVSDGLDVEVIKETIGGIRTVGSVSIVTAKGMLVTPTVTEEELKSLADFFKVQVKPGTANYGSIFVGSSMIANSKGVVVGDTTTPIEIGRVDDVLS